MSRQADQVFSQPNMNRLLCPRSVAVIGASEKRGSLGASVLENLNVAGFQGEIHLVNPNRAQIGSKNCFASVDDLPQGVDCAVLAIPRQGVLDAVRACARKGVGGVIIFSAGFAETGSAGRADQEELVAIARDSGMVIEGPNCLGFVNANEGVALTFIATPKPAIVSRFGVGIISQSGAMACVLGVAFRVHALEFTYSISTGNEAVSGVEDYVEYLLADERTKVIALLVEQFRNPQRFLSLAERAVRCGKRIALLHPGSSSAARVSAATHTGAIAGDYEVMRTKVAHAGVVIVETLEELIDVTSLLFRFGDLPSSGAAVLTESGAFKALTLDLCERIGLTLPQLSQETCAALRKELPDFVQITNPLDLTAQGLVDPGLYRRTLPPLLRDEFIGSVILTIILTDENTGALKLPPILEAIEAILLAERSKPIVFAALDEQAYFATECRVRLLELGVPVFPTAERALRALARVTAMRKSGTVPAAVAPVKVGPKLTAGVLPEYKSKQFLASAGVSIPRGAMAQTLEEGIACGEQIGYPVVLKAQSAALPHKSDAGGVVLNLRDAQELASSWERLHANLAAASPGLELDGVLVEKMGGKGRELILGARNDPQWGPVLLIGLGGVFAEAFRDARLLVPNLSVEEIVAEFSLLRGAALLRSFRGSPAPDVRAVAEIAKKLGELLVEHPEIREVDINPVIAFEDGHGAVALDALIVCN